MKREYISCKRELLIMAIMAFNDQQLTMALSKKPFSICRGKLCLDNDVICIVCVYFLDNSRFYGRSCQKLYNMHMWNNWVNIYIIHIGHVWMSIYIEISVIPFVGVNGQGRNHKKTQMKNAEINVRSIQVNGSNRPVVSSLRSLRKKVKNGNERRTMGH